MNPYTTDNTQQATAQAATAQTDDLAAALSKVQDDMNFEAVQEPGMTSPPPVGLSPAPAAPVTPMPTSTPVPTADEVSTPSAKVPHPMPAATPVAPAAPVTPMPTSTPAPAPTPTDSSAPAGDAGQQDVIEQIKISALQQLRPLMQHIDLSPEERFEKYLMMLRASDDPALIQPTYEAAQQITNEKLRAQALLDVINEINYLTAQQII